MGIMRDWMNQSFKQSWLSRALPAFNQAKTIELEVSVFIFYFLITKYSQNLTNC